MSPGESIGKAWAAVYERMPAGWEITELKRTQMAWRARAEPRPADTRGWRYLKEQKIPGQRLRASLPEGLGVSPVDALIELAVQLEVLQGRESHEGAARAVEMLFAALFPNATQPTHA